MRVGAMKYVCFIHECNIHDVCLFTTGLKKERAEGKQCPLITKVVY
jgi:hypothetical protein